MPPGSLGRSEMERTRRKDEEREMSLRDTVNLSGQALGSLVRWENNFISTTSRRVSGVERSLTPCASCHALRTVDRPMEPFFFLKKISVHPIYR